jgi:ACS family hexuronate transporter-like MFS transporter
VSNPYSNRYRWVILGTLFFLHVFTSVGQFSIPPLLPFIKEDLALNYTQVGIFTSAFFFGIGLTATLGGWTADSLGVRRMVVLGTLFMGTVMAIAAWMPTFMGIISLLTFAGVCYSVVTPCTNKATMYWFHKRMRATAMGIKQTGISGGGFLAALIIPSIAVKSSWHHALSLVGLLVLVGGLLMLIFYREIEPSSRHRIPLREWSRQIKKVISNRNVLLLGADGFFRVGVQNSFLTYLILYLQKNLQLPVITASLFFGLAHVSGALGRITWGLVSDRMLRGRRKGVYMYLAIISGLGLFLLGILTPDTPIWGVILIVGLLGFTAVGHQGVGLSFIAEVAEKDVVGTASGFNQSFYYFGAVVIVPLFGFLVDLFGTYSYAWTILALFSFTASGIVCFVKEQFKYDDLSDCKKVLQ